MAATRRRGSVHFGKPRRGEEHPLAKMSNAQAERLKRRYRAGEATLRDLAREAKVDTKTVWRAVNGHTYRDS